MKKLTVEQFVEKYSGAPLDERGLTDTIVSKVARSSMLYNKALALQVARDALETELDFLGFEPG